MPNNRPAIHQALIAILTTITLAACGSDSPSPISPPVPPAPPAVPVLAAKSVTLDDATNLGDARDLVIAFTTSFDQTNIQEYRVMIVAQDAAGGFTLARADAVGSGRYVTEVPATGPHTVTPPEGMTDVDGQIISDGGGYVAFVLSVGGAATTGNALSTASNTVTLAVTSIKITYLGNAGVVIDGLTENVTGWIQMEFADFAQLTAGTGPFAEIDVVMASHIHADHFSPLAVGSFMSSNSQASFLAPSEVISSLNLGSSAAAVAPARGNREEIELRGITIEVLPLRHYDVGGNDFSGVENYGFIVHLGGKKILHIGDAAYSAANFERFGLSGEAIDVVIVTAWGFLLSSLQRGRDREPGGPRARARGASPGPVGRGAV